MQENFTRRDLSAPDEGIARKRCLGKGAAVLDLDTLKDFFRFQASIMRGKITKKVEKPTDDSLVAFRECSFTGFTRMIGTEVSKDERSGCSNEFFRKVYNLIFFSGYERPSQPKIW